MYLNRKAFITQKRATLKGQITGLTNAVSNNKIDQANAQLRLTRVETLFHNYEELHDELSIGEPEDAGLTQFTDIQDDFYAIATRIRSMPDACGSQTQSNGSLQNTSVAAGPIANSTMFQLEQNVKLPVIDIPKFDGNLNDWLSFKNTFLGMIGSRNDMNGLQKFWYLKFSTIGPARQKLERYDASQDNYEAALKLLIESYERKRMLAAKHIDAIFDIAPLKNATAEGLSKIIDDARQHISMLGSLEITADTSFYALIIRWLERLLPINVRREWEKTLNLDTLPTFEAFSTFITEYAFRMSIIDQENSRYKGTFANKRPADRDQQARKYKKEETGVRSLITSANPPNSSNNCVQCQQGHPLFRCPEFAKLSVQQRWNVVKTHKVCQNCLRTHAGACNSTHCKLCPKFHNTHLHSAGQNANSGKTKPDSKEQKSTS